MEFYVLFFIIFVVLWKRVFEKITHKKKKVYLNALILSFG